jgi:hypothetical protein
MSTASRCWNLSRASLIQGTPSQPHLPIHTLVSQTFPFIISFRLNCMHFILYLRCALPVTPEHFTLPYKLTDCERLLIERLKM